MHSREQSDRLQIQPFAALQDSLLLTNLHGCIPENVGRNGVELEHFVVTGNHSSRTDFLAEIHGFGGGEVARHAALWITSVNGEEGDVNLPVFEPFC